MRSDFLGEERRSRRSRAAAALVAAAGAAAVAVGSWRAVLPDAAAPLRDPPLQRPASSPPPPRAGNLRTRPLAAWLADIAGESGRDLVLAPELKGDLTASDSSSLDWRQRLEAYSRVGGFVYTLDEGIIEARRGEPGAEGSRRSQKRGSAAGGKEADLAAGAATEESASAAPALPLSPESAAASAAAAKPEAHTRVMRLAHSSAKDLAAALARPGEALGVAVAADPASNSLLLTGPEPSLARAAAVAAKLDLPRRRLLLEAKIIEVTRSGRLDLGVEWKLAGSVGSDLKFPPALSDAGSAALVVATGGASALDARISALEAGGKLHVVSRPSVVMLEGSPATIESARILRIRLPSRGTVVGDQVVEAPASGRATEDIPVGVRLEVTPAIRDGSRVSLRIKAKSSSLGAPLPPDDIPEELSRMVDAEVLVSDGETVVLGGLTREAGTRSGAGVPGLRSIPGVGVLFGKRSRADEDEELLVLVTPRLLD